MQVMPIRANRICQRVSPLYYIVAICYRLPKLMRLPFASMLQTTSCLKITRAISRELFGRIVSLNMADSGEVALPEKDGSLCHHCLQFLIVEL